MHSVHCVAVIFALHVAVRAACLLMAKTIVVH